MTLTAHARDLLEHTAKRIVQAESFDMSRWYSVIEYRTEGTTRFSCGTPLCAAGHLIAEADHPQVEVRANEEYGDIQVYVQGKMSLFISAAMFVLGEDDGGLYSSLCSIFHWTGQRNPKVIAGALRYLAASENTGAAYFLMDLDQFFFGRHWLPTTRQDLLINRSGVLNWSASL